MNKIAVALILIGFSAGLGVEALIDRPAILVRFMPHQAPTAESCSAYITDEACAKFAGSQIEYGCDHPAICRLGNTLAERWLQLKDERNEALTSEQRCELKNIRLMREMSGIETKQ